MFGRVNRNSKSPVTIVFMYGFRVQMTTIKLIMVGSGLKWLITKRKNSNTNKKKKRLGKTLQNILVVFEVISVS